MPNMESQINPDVASQRLLVPCMPKYKYKYGTTISNFTTSTKNIRKDQKRKKNFRKKKARNSSPALAATLMLMMVLCRNFEFVVADPNHVVANNEANFHFRFACAMKCAAKCFMLPTIPEKVACATACLRSCLHKSSPSGKVNTYTLDCANSAGNKFFSEAGNKFSSYEDFEKLAGFVDICYDKCSKKAD